MRVCVNFLVCDLKILVPGLLTNMSPVCMSPSPGNERPLVSAVAALLEHARSCPQGEPCSVAVFFLFGGGGCCSKPSLSYHSSLALICDPTAPDTKSLRVLTLDSVRFDFLLRFSIKISDRGQTEKGDMIDACL